MRRRGAGAAVRQGAGGAADASRLGPAIAGGGCMYTPRGTRPPLPPRPSSHSPFSSPTPPLAPSPSPSSSLCPSSLPRPLLLPSRPPRDALTTVHAARAARAPRVARPRCQRPRCARAARTAKAALDRGPALPQPVPPALLAPQLAPPVQPKLLAPPRRSATSHLPPTPLPLPPFSRSSPQSQPPSRCRHAASTASTCPTPPSTQAPPPSLPQTQPVFRNISTPAAGDRRFSLSCTTPASASVSPLPPSQV